MKKLIAVLAMVALISGAAFAQIGGNVIGTIYFAKNGINAEGDDAVVGSGEMNRLRVHGGGTSEDGTFGGYVRITTDHWADAFFGHAWWKPMDMLKLTIGENPDGWWGKEGVTGWMFQQMISDTGVVNPNNIWYAPNGYYGDGLGGLQYRDAFFGGTGDVGDRGLFLDITPADMFAINIGLPFIDMDGEEVADIFKSLVLQIDLNLDFGNIALTYKGDASDDTNGNIYLYAGLGLMDNFSLDIGFGMTLAGDEEGQPFNIGLGAKYDVSDEFGLKFRTVASLGGDDEVTRFMLDILPYYAINDSMKFFCSIGFGMLMFDGDSFNGFHINPYLEIGNEWGPTFYVGLKAWKWDEDDMSWEIPLAIGISF